MMLSGLLPDRFPLWTRPWQELPGHGNLLLFLLVFLLWSRCCCATCGVWAIWSLLTLWCLLPRLWTVLLGLCLVRFLKNIEMNYPCHTSESGGPQWKEGAWAWCARDSCPSEFPGTGWVSASLGNVHNPGSLTGIVFSFMKHLHYLNLNYFATNITTVSTDKRSHQRSSNSKALVTH